MKRDLFFNWHRKKLQEHTSEVDIDAIWAAIEPEVDNINVDIKKRRRFFFFLLCLCVGIIGVGFSSLFINNQSDTAKHISSAHNINHDDKKEGIHIANIQTEVVNNAKLITATDENIPTQQNNTTTNSTVPTHIFSPSKTIKDDGIKEKIWQHSRKVSTPQIHLNQGQSKDLQNTPLRAESPTAVLINSISNTAQNANSAKSAVIVVDAIEKDRVALDIPSLLPASDTDLLLNDEADFPSKKVITNKASAFKFSVDLYSGVAFAQRKLSLKNIGDNEELIILRDGTERGLELWNNGVNAKLRHKSGLFLTAGIQYSRIAENFKYNIDHVEMDSIANKVIGYSNNLLGDRSEIYGYEPNNALHELEYDFYNYYHFLNVPVSLGYQKQFGFWNVGLKAGVVYNLSLRTKGRILENIFTVADVGNKVESPFLVQAPLSYEFGLSTGFLLSSNLELGLEAFHRQSPKSITNEDYILDQKYSATGLNVSLNYLF